MEDALEEVEVTVAEAMAMAVGEDMVEEGEGGGGGDGGGRRTSRRRLGRKLKGSRRSGRMRVWRWYAPAVFGTCPSSKDTAVYRDAQGAFARVSSAPTLENENQDPGHRSGRRTPLAEIRLLLPSRLLILTSTRPLAFAFIVGSSLPHPAAMLV